MNAVAPTAMPTIAPELSPLLDDLLDTFVVASLNVVEDDGCTVTLV
jgi:hypothetical protein